MQSKFGLKDFVMLVLLIGLGVMVFLTMKQDDRQWRPIQEADAKLREQSAMLARLSDAIESRAGGGGEVGAITDRAALAQAQTRQAEALSKLSDEVAATNQKLAELIEAMQIGYSTIQQRLEDLRLSAAQNEAALAQRLTEVQAPGIPAGHRPPTGGMPAPVTAAPGGAGAGGRDEAWARPDGGPVVWASPQGLAKPPQGMPGYAEGGTFVEIFEGQPPNIVPYRFADVYARRVVDQVCESLGSYDPVTLRLDGLLAEAWQYDPGGMWLRVKIQPRARFSDGQPVTAEDVRFTFHDHMFNMEIEAERFRGTYNGIAKVEPLSEKVVEITFKEKRFDNLDQALILPIIPKHFYSRFQPAEINRSTGLLMGSGPFRLASLDADNQWTPPQDIVLVRNEQYWGVQPQFERLRFKTITDGLARLTAYTNGEGDMVRPTADQFSLNADEPGFADRHHLLNWFNMRSGYAFIAWQAGERNGRLRPFHDRRVRLAMTHMIDRDRVVRDIYKGLGKVATGPFNPATEQADNTIRPWPYDLRKARALLTEAGWADRDQDGVLENAAGERFEFEFTYSTGSETVEKLARYLRQQCADVGILCTLKPTDWSVFQSILQTRDFDALTMAWSQNSPEADPNQIWHSSSIRNQGDNFIQWASPEGDRLIEEGRREVRDAERMAIWRRLHRHFHEEQPYTFLINIPWLRFVNKRVENVNTYPKGLEQREMFIRLENQALLN